MVNVSYTITAGGGARSAGGPSNGEVLSGTYAISATGTFPAVVGAGGAAAVPSRLIYRIGQSNAVTSNLDAADAAAVVGVNEPVDFYIWDHAAGAWQLYEYGVNTGHQGDASFEQWSVEAIVAKGWRDAGYTGDIFCIKEAVAGNAIDPVYSNGNWWPGGIHVDEVIARNPGSRWVGLLAQRDAALAATGAPVSPDVYVCLNQGEAEINTDGASALATRLDSMTKFIAKVRAELTATGPFVIERPRPGIDGSSYNSAAFPRSYNLREADLQAALAATNVHVVDADATFPANTAVHPSVGGTAWIEALGPRVQAAFDGAYTATYGAITDTVPDAFSFSGVTVAASATGTSAAVTPAGFQRRTTISVTGGEYRVLNADDSVAVDWTSVSGNFEKFQKVLARGTASATGGGTQDVVVTIGGVASTFTVTTESADVTAPTLSSPTDAANGATGGTLSVSTNEGNGTLFWVVTGSATAPSQAQVAAGQDHAGAAAAASGSLAVSATGVQNVSATGLTASTGYFAHFMHRDAATNDSTVASGDGFTTEAAAGPLTTWNTAFRTTDVTYSESDAQVVRAGGGGIAVQALGGKSTGKWAVLLECILDAPLHFGIYTSGMANNTGGMTNARAAMLPSGALRYPNGSGGEATDKFISGGIGVGDFAMVFLDADAELVWIQPIGSDPNGDAAADPATGAGGMSIAALTGPYYIGAALDLDVGSGLRIHPSSHANWIAETGFTEWTA